MERLTVVIYSFCIITFLTSCTAQKDYTLLDLKQLEIVNNGIEKECLKDYDNSILIAVLEKNNYEYIIKDEDVYVEKKLMENRSFFEEINRDIQHELRDSSIPEEYTLFKYRRLNTRTNEYETRPIDDLDKALLPKIINNSGFDYIVKNDCLYVDKELIENQDFLSKVVHDLDAERKKAAL